MLDHHVKDLDRRLSVGLGGHAEGELCAFGLDVFFVRGLAGGRHVGALQAVMVRGGNCPEHCPPGIVGTFREGNGIAACHIRLAGCVVYQSAECQVGEACRYGLIRV